MYGYALISGGVNEEDEQLTMAPDLDVLIEHLRHEIAEYPEYIREDIEDFVSDFVDEKELNDCLRVGLDIYDENGEHGFNLRFEKVW